MKDIKRGLQAAAGSAAVTVAFEGINFLVRRRKEKKNEKSIEEILNENASKIFEQTQKEKSAIEKERETQIKENKKSTDPRSQPPAKEQLKATEEEVLEKHPEVKEAVKLAKEQPKVEEAPKQEPKAEEKPETPKSVDGLGIKEANFVLNNLDYSECPDVAQVYATKVVEGQATAEVLDFISKQSKIIAGNIEKGNKSNYSSNMKAALEAVDENDPVLEYYGLDETEKGDEKEEEAPEMMVDISMEKEVEFETPLKYGIRTQQVSSLKDSKSGKKRGTSKIARLNADEANSLALRMMNNGLTIHQTPEDMDTED